ncbi:thiolase family protein [Haloechinothrix salitolerans]|uniref:propanoyl-CoA C-acyltransferase n=1 Tax=Haloechinothrix salitolerans TaxID=926830 RepID=A0ABW2BZF7_9PSEU
MAASIRDTYILGIGVTPVGRYPDRSFTDLVADAYGSAVKDAQLADPDRIEGTWFSNMLADFWGLRAMRGLATLAPLVEDGLFPNGQRITNVEAGCASASAAFNGAWSAIQSGADLTLAIGVEKMNPNDGRGAELLEWMNGGLPESYWEPFRRLADQLGVGFGFGSDRSMAMDVYALLALSHMRDYGTTIEQIAASAAKNHTNAVHNPRAQYRFPMSTDDVLADRVIADPLTRAMAAPRGDGAGAILVCSEDFLTEQPTSVRDRALKVRGHSLAGGRINASWEDQRSPVVSAAQTYQMAGLTPRDLDLVELHDATSFAEIHLIEDLGLCERGHGGPFTASGATQLDGEIPVNPSGGLVSRGHPIGATGIMMLYELAVQLRGEAGETQVPNARIAMAENGGGIVGLDIAVTATTILERVA